MFSSSFQNIYINIHETNENLEKEFLKYIRLREIPSKFWYWWEESTQSRINLCKLRDYAPYTDSIALLNNIVDDILSFIPETELNHIDLWCWNWEKDLIILNKLHKVKQVNSFLIDSSVDMIRVALERLKNLWINSNSFVSWFEHMTEIIPNIRKNFYKTNFITLLWNTLWNFHQTELLNLIRKNMTYDDYFLVWVSVLNENSYLEQYNNMDYLYSSFVPLKRLWIVLSDWFMEYEKTKYRFFPDLDVFNVYFKFNKDKDIVYEHDELNFKKWERILTEFSCKYSIDNLRYILTSNWFNIVKLFENSSKNYVKILCKLK